MIWTLEERWNVEYLSGVTNEVVELVSVARSERAEIPEPPGFGKIILHTVIAFPQRSGKYTSIV
jgi:hypothetical protein